MVFPSSCHDCSVGQEDWSIFGRLVHVNRYSFERDDADTQSNAQGVDNFPGQIAISLEVAT